LGDSQDDAGIDGELVPAEDEQIVEARPLPVVADSQPSSAIVTHQVSLPATVAAAGGGFMLGVAAFMLMRILRRPTAARSVARRRKRMLAKRQGVDIAASRSFLVDVHLLKR
jgi:ABC-type Fe3+-siderophore transport system permease subunit